MSRLQIFSESNNSTPIFFSEEPTAIVNELKAVGIRFERWQATSPLEPGASSEAVIAAYQADIDRLKREGGYQAVDVVSLNPDHPDRVALRQKFLSEHTHSEDEVRFFVAGQGLFTLHIKDKVYEVLCQQGDLISVPANAPHWFDMSERPYFIAIRLFTNPAGWVASFTGDTIAERFSRLCSLP